MIDSVKRPTVALRAMLSGVSQLHIAAQPGDSKAVGTLVRAGALRWYPADGFSVLYLSERNSGETLLLYQLNLLLENVQNVEQ